jgi:hypothetical protein
MQRVSLSRAPWVHVYWFRYNPIRSYPASTPDLAARSRRPSEVEVIVHCFIGEFLSVLAAQSVTRIVACDFKGRGDQDVSVIVKSLRCD